MGERGWPRTHPSAPGPIQPPKQHPTPGRRRIPCKGTQCTCSAHSSLSIPWAAPRSGGARLIAGTGQAAGITVQRPQPHRRRLVPVTDAGPGRAGVLECPGHDPTVPAHLLFPAPTRTPPPCPKCCETTVWQGQASGVGQSVQGRPGCQRLVMGMPLLRWALPLCDAPGFSMQCVPCQSCPAPPPAYMPGMSLARSAS